MSEYLRDRGLGAAGASRSSLIPAATAAGAQTPAGVRTVLVADQDAMSTGTKIAIVGALGVVGFLVYRHFKKGGATTPTEGQ